MTRYYQDHQDNLYILFHDSTQTAVNPILMITGWDTRSNELAIKTLGTTLPNPLWSELPFAIFLAKVQYMAICAHNEEGEPVPDKKLIDLLYSCIRSVE